jgi:ABC-2 type transport system permease protein
VAMLALGVTGFVLAAIWLPTGRTPIFRTIVSLGVVSIFAIALWGASLARVTWDLSENRRNSFSEITEASLRQIRDPLRVTVYLAAEDPRLMDLDRNILSKLERILPRVEIDYAAHTRAGLFEGAADHYGEVWYEMGGRKVLTRSTTENIVLDTLYKLAQVSPPVQPEANDYAGHPLPARPVGAAWIYYFAWPLVVALAGLINFRK